MTTTMRLLPVRVSATLRAVIDQAGPVNPATRALIILGATSVGWDLRGLEREIAALLAADLHDDVHTATRWAGGIPTRSRFRTNCPRWRT